MANRQNSLQDHEAHLVRHPHDIAAGYTASLSTGMIVPQYFHILNAGDTIYYNSHFRARLTDIVTAFLGEVEIHLEYFFVPLQMLYTPFGQVYSQTDDYISSLFTNPRDGDGLDVSNYPKMSPSSFSRVYDDDHGLTDPTPWSSEASIIGRSRLMDALDVNSLYCIGSEVAAELAYVRQDTDVALSLTKMPNIVPWLFAAYQAIYQKFYRNEDIERLDVASYNFDQYFDASEPFVNPKFTELRYVQRVSDYFTSARISPIATTVNHASNRAGDTGIFNSAGGTDPDVLLGDLSTFINGMEPVAQLPGTSTQVNVGEGATLSHDFYSVSGRTFNDDTSYSWLNTQNIRTLFAVERYARIYGRAGKTYDDQILAHFGVKVPHDVKHDATKVSSHRFVLQADPIYSTSDTPDGSSLGQLGGQSMGELNIPQKKFTAPVHGVFMAVAFARARPRYIGTFSKLNLLGGRIDFPIAEYDKLGAQPMYGYEFNPNGIINMAHRVAWQNRYQQFKKKYNRASYYFADHYYNLVHSSTTNAFAPWVLSRYPLEPSDLSNDFIPLKRFFETPHALDSVMAVPFNGAWSNTFFAQPHLMYQSDPIVTEFMCDAKLVSWMSPTGEPDL